MRRLVGLFLVLLFPCGWALTLEEAWGRVEERTRVVTAGLDVQEAEAALGRTQADPLALRPERVQAEQRLLLTQAQLEQARFATQAEIASAYIEALEAEGRAELAEVALGLSEQALSIAEIRFERGGATELDVREAQQSLQDARNTLQAAQEALRLSLRNLETMLRLEDVAPQPVPDALLPVPPDIAAVLAALDGHPDLLELNQLVELAEMNVELLDPSFAPRFQIENAERQLQAAREGRLEARRGFELRARSLHLQAENAYETWGIRQEGLATARERLGLQASRLQAGLIAEVDYRREELQVLQAELEALQARHGYLGALLDLQAGTMYRIFEYPVFDAVVGGEGRADP